MQQAHDAQGVVHTGTRSIQVGESDESEPASSEYDARLTRRPSQPSNKDSASARNLLDLGRRAVRECGNGARLRRWEEKAQALRTSMRGFGARLLYDDGSDT